MKQFAYHFIPLVEFEKTSSAEVAGFQNATNVSYLGKIEHTIVDCNNL